MAVFYTVGVKPFFAEEYEDSEEAIAYLAQRVQTNDVLYVYAAMREQFKLYAGVLPSRNQPRFLWKGWYALLSSKGLSQPAARIRRRCYQRGLGLKRRGSGAIPMALELQIVLFTGFIYSVTILSCLNAVLQIKAAQRSRKENSQGFTSVTSDASRNRESRGLSRQE